MSAPPRRWGKVLRTVLLLACVPPALLLGVNVFINLWLPLIINQEPERVRVNWAIAWMIVPGDVEVRGLTIRSQSPFDQLSVTVDETSGTIVLGDLLHKQFHARDLVAKGGSFRYRARKDAPTPPGPVEVANPEAPRIPDSLLPDDAAEPAPPPAPVEPTRVRTPPIEGLVNPPVPNPEAIYPTPSGYWTIKLAEVVLRDVREIWIEDYHFVGNAALRADEFTLQPTLFVALANARVQLLDGQVLLGEDAALLGVKGEVSVSLDGLAPQENPGRSVFGFLTIAATVEATVKNLAFLDFYLRSAPWLDLSGGTGALAIDVRMRRGEFEPGSVLTAGVKDISARFLSYSIVGDGRVKFAVDVVEGLPESRLDVNFDNFAIARGGDAAPHATGAGLRVTARTADVSLDDPFSALRIEIDLPASTIPDAQVYNAYLPKGIGLHLRDGHGTVSGHLEVTTPENIARGHLSLAARGLRVTLDELTLTGNVALEVVVPRGGLDTGRYDISGSVLTLRSVRVSGHGSRQQESDNSRGWWATLRVPKGVAASGTRVLFDASLAVKMRDTVPLVTIFSSKEPLPRWVRGLLNITDLSGTARIQLGDEVFHIPRLELQGAKKFKLLLALERQGRESRGKLFVHYGILQAGVRLDGDKRKIVIFTPRKWYDRERLGT